MLQKTVSELSGSTSKLEFDIYEEVGIPNSTVSHNVVHYLCSSCHTVYPMFYHADFQIPNDCTGGYKFSTTIRCIKLDICDLQYYSLSNILNYVTNLVEHP